MSEIGEIERDIARALFRRVGEMVKPGAVWTKGLPVAWANTAFSAPEGPYLRVYNIFGDTERMDIGRGRYHTLTGLLQITYMIPENAGEPFREASKIIGYFPPDLKLIENGTEVRVMERPSLGPFIRGRLMPYGPHWEQPVNVNWRASVTTN